jgi:hypothetical protein
MAPILPPGPFERRFPFEESGEFATTQRSDDEALELPYPQARDDYLRMDDYETPQRPERDFMNPFSRTLTLPHVERPENWRLDPQMPIPESWMSEEQTPNAAEGSRESGDREERVERAVAVVEDVAPEIRQWRNALVATLRQALATTGEATIVIMRGITRNGIRISRELAQEIVANPDILTGALLFMLYGALTTPLYEEVYPVVEHHETFDLGGPSSSEDYMNQIPRFIHNSFSSTEMNAARSAYLAMRPFVLFMRGGAAAVFSRPLRRFMNDFGQVMRELAEANAERWARVDDDIRQVVAPLQFLPLPDGRPIQQPFQAFAGRAHRLPALADLPRIPALEDAPRPAPAANAPPVAGLNPAPPIPLPDAPRALTRVPRPGERPPRGEADARAKAKAKALPGPTSSARAGVPRELRPQSAAPAPSGPTSSSRAGVPPQLRPQSAAPAPAEAPGWALRPGSRPPRGGNKTRGKTLIHVPAPILEYFDVKNDHFMMK